MGIGDLDEVVRIESACFSTPWSRATFEQLLDEDQTIVLVAEMGTTGGSDPAAGNEDGLVAGYVVLWWVVDQAEVANLAVDPRHRGRGIGGALLDRALSKAEAEGVTQVFLEVRRSNLVARSMYEGKGFRTVGLRRGYYSRPKEDARIMMKRIGDAS